MIIPGAIISRSGGGSVGGKQVLLRGARATIISLNPSAKEDARVTAFDVSVTRKAARAALVPNAEVTALDVSVTRKAARAALVPNAEIPAFDVSVTRKATAAEKSPTVTLLRARAIIIVRS